MTIFKDLKNLDDSTITDKIYKNLNSSLTKKTINGMCKKEILVILHDSDMVLKEIDVLASSIIDVDLTTYTLRSRCPFFYKVISYKETKNTKETDKSTKEDVLSLTSIERRNKKTDVNINTITLNVESLELLIKNLEEDLRSSNIDGFVTYMNRVIDKILPKDKEDDKEGNDKDKTIKDNDTKNKDNVKDNRDKDRKFNVQVLEDRKRTDQGIQKIQHVRSDRKSSHDRDHKRSHEK
jgi:hypothetical protein